MHGYTAIEAAGKAVAIARGCTEKIRERLVPLLRRAPRPLVRAWGKFTSPADALPIDLFRALVGLVSCAYFVRTLREARDYSSPHGLIDHELVRDIFPFTRWGLFRPGMSLPCFRALYTLATLGSLLLALGVRVKPVSAALFLTAVSTYRWNFPVTYLDDALMHLMLLWMLLLPTGRTLTLTGWIAERGAAMSRWREARVPGAAPRCFLANLALMYVVAGLWKWSSPLWRQGVAVYAGLKTPVAHSPQRWRPEHLPILAVANHLALVMEPLFPLAILLPTNHPLKLLLAAAMIGFHAGIVATLKIPFANALCIASTVMILRHECMASLRRGAPARPSNGETAPVFDRPAQAAALLVTGLTLAMVSDAVRPRWRSGTHPAVRADQSSANRCLGARQNPFYGALWCAGVAQSYRLFDWVDERNYHLVYDVTERRRDGTLHRLEPADLFPQTLRSVLLQSYLHDVMWMKVPRARLPDLQRSLFERYARRYCCHQPNTGRIEVFAAVQRTTPENLDLLRPHRTRFLVFACRDGEPDLRFMRLTQG